MSSHLQIGKFLGTCLLLVALTSQARIGTEYQMQLGNPTDAKPDTNNHQHYLIQRSVFAEDYDDERGEPNWVAWDLTADDLGTAKRTPTFHTDPDLPANFHHIKSADYKQSGFDRGHMCPSADRTDNAQDNEAVFTMANIIPQTPDDNEGVWEKLEADCRDLAKQGNELLIISGPASFGERHLQNGPVSIPTHNWKIVVVVSNGGGSVLNRITPATRVIAVDIPNIQGVRKDGWEKYVVSVNQIEALTGYNFFTALAPEVAATLKAKVDGHASEKVIYAKASVQTSHPSAQQPLWIPVAVVVLIMLLVLCVGVLIVFFKTKPSK